MPTQQETEQYLSLGHETRRFEVKGPGSLRSTPYLANVARAVMAMGNLRNGGVVCLGVDDKAMKAMKPGLTEDQFREWSDFDNVAAALGRYSDPPVSFHLVPLQLSSGAHVVVLVVDEFETVPHICKRDHEKDLRRGALYVRPAGKPESVHIPDATYMRDLLDLAVTKGVQAFVRQAGLAGVLPTHHSAEDRDREAFTVEAEAAWAGSKGWDGVLAVDAYFDVAIRPGPFDPARVPRAGLQDLIAGSTVRLRGWPVPMVGPAEAVKQDATWIGQDVTGGFSRRQEAWRLCTSGQYLQRRVLVTDRAAAPDPELAPTVARATGVVVLWDVLFYLVEIAELAARLATSVGCETVTIDVALRRVGGRQLVSGTWERELEGPDITSADTVSATTNVGPVELISDPAAVGVALTQDLIAQFGTVVLNRVLYEWQEQGLDRH